MLSVINSSLLIAELSGNAAGIADFRSACLLGRLFWGGGGGARSAFGGLSPPAPGLMVRNVGFLPADGFSAGDSVPAGCRGGGRRKPAGTRAGGDGSLPPFWKTRSSGGERKRGSAWAKGCFGVVFFRSDPDLLTPRGQA